MELVKQDYIAVPPMVVASSTELTPTSARMKRAALARLALGYKELSLAVAETRYRLTLQDVENGLRQAGVQVFDNKDVTQYKRNIKQRIWWGEGFWDAIPISEYDEPIPEFAIDTALRIKEAIPEAEFSVEYFVHRTTADPFLSFKVPGIQRRFVVEVWDEPDFTAERKERAA